MSTGAEQVIKMFQTAYMPYSVEGYTVPQRKPEEIKVDSKDRASLAMMNYIDSQRANDNFIGAKVAGKEIYTNLINWLKDGKGVHAETLIAVLGSIGGRECVSGIMSTLESLISDDAENKSQIINVIAGILDILIAETKSGERYIMGGRIANTFCSFYDTACSEQGKAVEKLKPLASEIAGKVGSPDYWKTHFDNLVGKSPKEIADIFEGKFEFTFNVYCRFPYERMLAFAIAAQNAMKQIESVMPEEKALSILAEYGWRTSHYWK